MKEDIYYSRQTSQRCKTMEQFYDIMELLYDKRSITLLLIKVLVINKLINKEMILV